MSNERLTLIGCATTVLLSIWTVAASGSTRVVVAGLQLVVIVMLAVGILALVRQLNNLRKVFGLQDFAKSRRLTREKELQFISDTRRSVRCVGIMHRSLWDDRIPFEQAILSAAARGATLDFYLCSSDSAELGRRAVDEHEIAADWSRQIELQIGRFRQFKRDHPTVQLRLFTYTAYPVWHLVCRDEDDLLVGWYPVDRTGYDAPLYELSAKEETSLASPLTQWLEWLERNAIEQTL